MDETVYDPLNPTGQLCPGFRAAIPTKAVEFRYLELLGNGDLERDVWSRLQHPALDPQPCHRETSRGPIHKR